MTIKFNSILISTVVAVLIFYSFAENIGTYLVGSDIEIYTLLTSVLCVLIINRKLKNEILEFVNTFFIFFFIIRIPFLFLDSVSSDVITRDVNFDHIPWYLLILTIQYLSFAIAIIIINPRISMNAIREALPEKVSKRILFFCSIITALNALRRFLYFDIYGGDHLSSFWSILGTVFNGKNILMVLVVMLLISCKSLITKFWAYVLILINILLFFYGGSKSIFLEFLLLIFLGILIVKRELRLNVKSLLLVTFGGVISILMYFLGVLSRGIHVNNLEYSIDNLVKLYNTRFGDSITYFVDSFSYRIGYLDFFIQKVALMQIYEPYVDLTYYAKSIIDRITPGFDFFGVPYAAASIYTAYNGEKLNGVANSEFVTIFGEAYILFGFFSIFFYMAMMLVVKYLISSYSSPYTINNVLFRIFIMMSIYIWLRGPGLDMVFLFAIYKGFFVLTIITVVKYFSKNFNRNFRQLL